jgi:ribosomal protein S18 acetylase RimI-like enzyme
VDVVALGPEDAAEAVAVWEEAGLTRPWNDPHEDFARAVLGPASAVLGTRLDGTLAGTAMVGHDGHRGWVYYLGVRPAYQRRGLGRALMAAAESWVRERDVPKIQLMVRHTNPAALAFYAALGYADVDCYVLARPLGAP